MDIDSKRKPRSTKRSIALVFLACSLVLIVFIFFGFRHFPHIGASQGQMNDAKRYMDSLTDTEIQAWIHRTQKILSEAASGKITNRDVPPDLQKLGISGIEESTDEIDYVWFGGMDNTALDVVLTSNGDFQVFAVYTPYTNRMIWPKHQ